MTKKSGQELRELVDSLHPRNPKEVMGEAANSSLLGSTITAALSTLLLLFGATVVVFLVGGGPEKKVEAAATPTSAPTSAATTEPESTQGEVGDASPPTATSEPSATLKSDTDAAVDAMGIGEAKEADSKPESLENRLDKLLDGLE